MTMRIGVNQVSVPGASVHKRLQWARKYGFEAIDLYCCPVPKSAAGLYAPALQLSEIRELKDALAGFSSVTVHAPYQQVFDTSLLSLNPGVRQASIQDIMLTMRLAEALGAGLVTCHTGVPPANADETWVCDELMDSLVTIDREAGAVRVALETREWLLGPGRLEMVAGSGLTNIGLTMNVARLHLHAASARGLRAGAPSGILDASMVDQVLEVYVSDSDGHRVGLALGGGKIDLPAVIDGLHRAGYAGNLVIDLDPDHCGPEAILHSKQALETIIERLEQVEVSEEGQAT